VSVEGLPGFDSRQEQGRGFLISAAASRPALGSTQPPVQSVPRVLAPGVKLTTRLHLAPMLRMRGAIPQPSHMFSWSGVS